MASKGQKFNKYSDEQRIKIMNKYLSGNYSSTLLSKKYNIPVKTIKNWIYKYNNKNYDLISKPYIRGRKNQENIDYKERYEILKKYQAFLKAQRERK
mgnify:CR=1 FL=1